jgi:hypothetical protein
VLIIGCPSGEYHMAQDWHVCQDSAMQQKGRVKDPPCHDSVASEEG